MLVLSISQIEAPAQTPASGKRRPASERSSIAAGDRRSDAIGGGAQADFDSLIDLIVATIAPDTWDDVGGDGSIQGFPSGVYVDTKGVLHELNQPTTERLAARWEKWNLQRQRVFAQRDIARHSPLRKVSVMRLVQRCRQLYADDLMPTDDMRHMAGLHRIDYLIFDATTGDCILAGPAGPWQMDRHGRHVSTPTGRPVLRLQDLIVLLQNSFFSQGQFVCTITPTQDGLVQAQNYIRRWSDRSVRPRGRKQWLQEFASALGLQRIEVQGIDASTRVARVIVEADHHMKQIGIGLEPGTDQVPSYLDRLVESGEVPDRMDVLRWWFTLHPEAVSVMQPDELYAFGSQAVLVLSENELLTREGRRVHTGTSDRLNERFASDFTADFDELARRYPIYADMDNVFRLALVAAIVKQHGAFGDPSFGDPSFGDPSFDLADWLKSDELPVATARAPAWVESIVNHRMVDRRTFVAAVSGGVHFTAPSIPSLPVSPRRNAPHWQPKQPSSQWWWD